MQRLFKNEIIFKSLSKSYDNLSNKNNVEQYHSKFIRNKKKLLKNGTQKWICFHKEKLKSK